MTKDIVILTKSTKWGGYCVAGVDAHSGEWVRLTSSDPRSHGALTDEHMTCGDGGVCKVLDCVRVEIVRETPINHQPENVLINERKRFQRLGAWSLRDVLRIHPAESPEVMYANTNPFLSEEDMERINQSLILIRTPWLCIKQKSSSSERSKTKANFLYNDQWYNNISVTDPEYYHAEDQTTLRSAYLVVSLPNSPFEDGRYYKFIAKIFT